MIFNLNSSVRIRRHLPSQTTFWDLDQVTVTRMILSSSLCSIPGNSSVWRGVDLVKPESPMDDSGK